MSLPVNPAPFTMFSSPPTIGEIATVVGVPLEYSGLGRPGSRLAPLALREASRSLVPYSKRVKLYLEPDSIGDIGDVMVVNVARTFGHVARVYRWLLDKGSMPILLGGEHSITYSIANVLQDYEEPLIVFMDAHLDAMNEYRGYRVASSTVTLRAAELLGGDRILHIGARSYHPREIEKLKEMGVKLLDINEYDRLVELVKASKFVHLSIDVDVLDPCYEPGAATPEPEGVTPATLYNIVHLVSRHAENLSLDIVEYTPLYDPSRVGGVYAAKILVEVVAARLVSGTSQAHR